MAVGVCIMWARSIVRVCCSAGRVPPLRVVSAATRPALTAPAARRWLHASRPRLNEAWLAEKAAEEGTVTLESGLMYKVLKAGNGSSPQLNSPCVCHYTGRLTDGTVFDSSVERGEPATFAPNQVIAGWTEALQMMKEGDKLELYIPSQLAYGSRGAGGVIPPDAALCFEIELIQVK